MRLNFTPTYWSLLLATICLFTIPCSVSAQLNCNTANGNSYDATTGIEAWSFGNTAGAGNFLGISSNNGDGDGNADGDISSSSNAWGLYSNNGSIANQITSFSIPFVVGDEISLDMDNGYIDGGGLSSVGFGLLNEIGENLFEIYYVGGETAYTINGAAGPTFTSVAFTDEGLSITLTLNTSIEIGVSITELATGTNTTYTANLKSVTGEQTIKRLRLFNSNAGSGSQYDAFFNNLEVCQSSTDNDGDGWYSDLDCDDSNDSINPGESEILFNGIDDDCNPSTLDYNSGIFESYVILDQFYDLQAQTSNPDFSSTNLGTFYCGDQYFLQGAQNKTFKCPDNEGADILGSKFYYRLTQAGQAYGAFTELPMSFLSNDGGSFGCIDQTWELNNAGIDLLIGLEPAEYVLDVYTTADYTYNGGSGTHISDNNGALYRAGFIVAADIINPEPICQDFNLVLGQNGIGVLEIEDLNNGSTDNCGIASMSLSRSTFTCNDLPTEPYTSNEIIISEYVSGNNLDNYLELFNGTPNSVDLSNYELRLYVGSQLTPIATDNLGTAGTLAPNETVVFCNPNSFSYTGPKTVLPNYSLAFQGRETIELFNISTNERVDLFGAIGEYPSPGWVVGGYSAILHTLRRLSTVHEGNVNAPAGFPTLGTEWEQFLLGDISDLGSHTFEYNTGDPSYGIELYVTDEAGNVGVCTSTVTIEIPLPIASCNDISVQLDENGAATIDPSDLDNGSTASCSTFSISASQTDFDCAHLGANTITLTVTDENGFSSNCTSTVTVEDNVNPNAVCQNISVELDETGNATITAADINNGSNDACGIFEMTATPLSFDINNVGANTVTLTVTDNNGNISTCEATVTVTGNVAPEAVCSDITVALDTNGEATIEASDIDGGSTAVAGIASISASQTTFDCTNIGGNIVVLTVTDINGLSSSCDAIVTVADIEAPMAICQDATITIGLDGSAVLSIEDVNNGSSDNCAINSMELSQTQFSCDDIPTEVPSGELIISEYIHGSLVNGGGVFIVNNYIEVYNGTPIPIDLANYEIRRYTTNAISPAAVDPLGAAGILPPGETYVFSQLFGTTYEGEQLELPNFTMIYNGNMAMELYNVTTNQRVDLIGTLGETPTNGWNVNGNSTKAHTLRRLPNITQGVTESLPGFPSLGTEWEQFPLDDMTGLGTHESNANLDPSFGVILTVNDANGNSSTCSSSVTFNYEAPELSCTNTTLYLDETGNAILTPSDLAGSISTSCGVDTITISQSMFDCAHTGETNVTLTVIDIFENENSCVSTVTVVDSIAPNAVCNDLTIPLDEYGVATLNPQDLDGGSFDNCGMSPVVIASQIYFDCTHIGDNLVTMTVIDVNGNTSICEATVTVTGDIAPEAVCTNTTIYLDENGQASITPQDIGSGSSAVCGLASVMASQTDFSCSDIGNNTVTLTVTDINGNSSTCDATVTVLDNTAPMAICQDVVIELNESGIATLDANEIDAGSFDNCGIVSMSLDQTTFDCTDIGSSPVYASDLFISEYVEGSSNNKYIEIYNGTGLDIDLSNYSLKLYSNGNNSPSSTSSLAAAGVLASGEVVVFSNSSATVYGGTTYDITAVGYNGDDAVALFNGTSQIDIFGAIGQDPGSNWSVSGNTTSEHSLRRIASVIQGNTSNALGFPSLGTEWSSASQNDVSDLGQHTSDAGATTGSGVSVTLTVTDAAGNASTCSANVTIEDNIAPTTICQDITVYLNESGEATIAAEDVNAGSNDNCGDVSLSIDRDTFFCSDISSESNGNQAWINEFHYDNSGNDVNEFIEVVANFDASNYEIDLYNGNGGSIYNSYTLGVAASSSDGYHYYLLSLAPNEIQNGPDGIALSDGNGGLIEFISYEGSFTGNGGPADGITSSDVGIDEGSAAIGESLQRTGNGNHGLSFTWSGPSANSPGAINNGQTVGSGIATIVELTSIDAFGNTSNCSATVTVLDNLAPNMVCQNITVNLDENGLATISVDDIDNGSSDNCGIETLEIDIDSFDCNDIGLVDITLTALDVNGNSASCIAQVTVEDNTNPTAICQDITVALDESGTAFISPNDIDNGSSDNCGISSMTLNQSIFDCADLPQAAPPVGDQVWINELHYDNASTDVNEGVEVVANFDISGYTLVAYNGSNGTSYQTVTIGSGDLSASDSGYDFYSIGMSGLQNGGPDGIALIDDANNVVEFISYEGSFTATNGPASGVSSTDIGVSETGSTQVGQSLQLTGLGQVASDFTWASPDSDTFGGTNNNQTFGGSNDGISVELTIVDNSGNQSMCTAMVNIVDLIAPEALCQDITISLDENGMANITPADVDNGSTDNCTANLIMSISNSSFDCSQLGSNTVTLMVADESGNVSTCTSTVTVIDDISPNAICQSITVSLDETGNATISTSDIDNGSNDNCGNVTLSIDSENFNCSNIGVNNVTLTVTDASGNSSTCIANVEVLDDTAPTVYCQNTTIYLDSNGMGNILITDIDNGSFDNCGITLLSLSQTQFDCSNAGANNVVLTAIDTNGNESTCTATVNVIDTIAPIAICQNMEIALGIDNLVTITVNDIDAGSTDNCGIVSSSLSQSVFDCSHLGENAVTLTVTDNSGNVSTCDATIIITDPIAPTAICQSALILLDTNGQASITVDQIDNGSFDNCEITGITLSQTDFDCSHLASNTVTMTVTDGFGNISSCESTVTVVDNISPNAIGQNLTLTLDANGVASLTAEDVNNGSYDNCSIDTISVNQTDFDCSDLGENTVLMTVSDISGNNSTFVATITIVDDTAPILNCQNASVSLDNSGFAEITASDLVASVSDNCNVASVEITNGQTYFGCEDEGMTFNLEITATDDAGNESTCSASVMVLAGLDSDGDGISDVCDFCFGDNSTGDTDGDGICDSDDICPGTEDLLDYDAECDVNISMSGSSLQANNGGIYCVSGPFNGGQINVSNGSTVRLSGSGDISINVQYNSTLEIMSGSIIELNSINVSWGANAMVVHSDAEVSYDDNFSPNGTVVNCGTITVDRLTVNYNKTFINNNTVEITDDKKTSTISGDLTNYGYIHTTGSMTSNWNGEIFNYCHIAIDRNMVLSRDLRNYAFINVGLLTTIQYNGRVHQYDGAMYQTNSCKMFGRFVGYGDQSFVKIFDATTMYWNGRFDGSLAACDVNGIETIYSPSPFTNGAEENCDVDIAVSECNPVGHEAIPHVSSISGTDDTYSNDLSEESTLGGIISGESGNHYGVESVEIKIWPNPTNGEATLTFTPITNERVRIELYSIDGSLVTAIFEGNVFKGVPHIENLNMSTCENGVYFIRFVQNDKVQTEKIVFTR